ncbi:hypothetical protein M8C21_027662 [Ambrosia artemisiifolia]|uniref:Uncharacterized protein n=1 Tax=Ambrosia artemisiifolia TaxID=4212 RepID=A0AAD5DF16_AMBAR|nr:hypothetical protein M8C21_027662 [Ambrosia artemisiifolia]
MVTNQQPQYSQLEELLKTNTDCLYFLASPLTCIKISAFSTLLYNLTKLRLHYHLLTGKWRVACIFFQKGPEKSVQEQKFPPQENVQKPTEFPPQEKQVPRAQQRNGGAVMEKKVAPPPEEPPRYKPAGVVLPPVYDSNHVSDNEEQFGRSRGQDFDLGRSVDYDVNHYNKEGYAWEDHRESNGFGRTQYPRDESPDQLNSSDLRHRLSKQRRDNNVGGLRREAHYNQRHDCCLDSGPLSNRLRGRIKIPGRAMSPGYEHGSRVKRDIDMGTQQRSRYSPGRSPHVSSNNSRVKADYEKSTNDQALLNLEVSDVANKVGSIDEDAMLDQELEAYDHREDFNLEEGEEYMEEGYETGKKQSEMYSWIQSF